jgi:hypothetical protein
MINEDILSDKATRVLAAVTTTTATATRGARTRDPGPQILNPEQQQREELAEEPYLPEYIHELVLESQLPPKIFNLLFTTTN